MVLQKRIFMFISLFFNINKNYFYEKYRFIKLQEKNKKTLFLMWYIFKNQVLVILSIIVSQLIFKSDLLCTILIVLLSLSMLISMNNKEWRLFYRADFISQIPDVRQRYFTVLLGNMFLKLFVENNIIILSILLYIYSHISIFNVILLTIIFIIVYCVSLSIYFIMYNCSLKLKKVLSFINYISSFIFTTVFSYILFDFIISIFIAFTNNLNNSNILSSFLIEGKSILNNIISLLTTNTDIVVIALIIYIFVVIILTCITIRYINNTSYIDKEDSKYIINNFFIIKYFNKLINIFYKNDITNKMLINKEYSLFTHIYKYNFKDYFFIIIADRSIAFLLATFLILMKYEFNATYLLLFIILPIIVVMDINSSIGVKLVTNLSFISDYNTLLIANTSGFNIKDLINAKLKFFYTIKLASYIIFIIIYNTMFIYFNTSIYIIILINILVILIIIIFPKLYLINNLIYCRMNYRDYHKYLDESEILDYGVSEFYPLNILFKLWILLLVFTIIFTSILVIIDMNTLLLILISVLVLTSSITTMIMHRVYNNIISFIERGNYSADFAKIFKE